MNLGSFFCHQPSLPMAFFMHPPLSKHFGFTFFAIDPIASRLKKSRLFTLVSFVAF